MENKTLSKTLTGKEEILKYFTSPACNSNINYVQNIEVTILQITKCAELLQKGLFREAKSIYESILYQVNRIELPILDLIKLLCNHHLSTIYAYNKEWKKAKEHLEKAVNYCKSPDDKMFLQKMLAEAFFGIKQYSEAQKIFKQLINNKYKDSLNCKIWLARCLYNEDIINKGQPALEILENEVIKVDPHNIERLIYLSELAYRRGMGRLVVDHLGLALGFQSAMKLNIPKDCLETGQFLFSELMKDPENLKFFDRFKEDISIYKFLSQILKENSLVETVINLHIRALTFPKVKSSNKDIINLTLQIVSHYEIINKYQSAYEFYRNFIKNHPDLSVGSLKNFEIYHLFHDLKDIFSEENRKEFKDVLMNSEYDPDYFDESLPPYSDFELDLLALHFQIFKMLYVAGALCYLPRFANVLHPLRKGRTLHKTIIKNQNSYFSMCSSLLQYLKFENYQEKIYVCGDSHSLVPSWHVINGKLIVPKLVTGLKCWHMRKESRFFTKLNFETVIGSIPDNSTVIFIFGEIDCREGIIGSVEKCKYADIYEAIKFTADIYLNTLNELKSKKKLNPIIHPVVPVIDVTRMFVVPFNDYLRKQNQFLFMDFEDSLLLNDKKDLNKVYELDGTHLSPKYIELMGDYLK
jgi:tetratricopeptide (TPR) repeat protein